MNDWIRTSNIPVEQERPTYWTAFIASNYITTHKKFNQLNLVFRQNDGTVLVRKPLSNEHLLGNRNEDHSIIGRN